MTVAGIIPLFDREPPLPEGLVYQPDFIDIAEEAALIAEFEAAAFGDVRMHGIVAKRRVMQYGWHYGFDRRALSPGKELPPSLLRLQTRVAALTKTTPEAWAEALVTEYQPGAAIGWHRDAPPFGHVAGISLRSSCRFRFRRGDAGAREVTELELAPRSVYVLTGPARTEWQHTIPPAKELRYSITFRTLRKR